MDSLVVTGARVFLYVNGKKFARCTGMSYSISTPSREIEGIDSDEPFELAPTRQRVQVQLQLLRTVADGGLQGIGVSPVGAQLPRAQYFTLALVERLTDTVLFRSDWCRAEGENWSVAAKGRMEGSVTVKCMTFNNEVVPKT